MDTANATANTAAVSAPTPPATLVTLAAANSASVLVKQQFHFKTERIKDAEGKVIGEGKKHPSVGLELPLPTIQQLQTYCADTTKHAKELELVLSSMLDQVYRVARSQINDFRDAPATKEQDVTQATLNYEKLDWTAIANMPKGERSSSVPSDEDIKAFLDSYLAVMPAAAGKKKESIENHILCFSTGFKKQRSQKEILEVFVNSLKIYVANAGDELVEEHEEVIEYFSNRLARLLKTEETISIDDL